MAYRKYRHHRHHRHSGGNYDDPDMGCVVRIIFALIAMPLVGIYMLIKGKDDD